MNRLLSGILLGTLLSLPVIAASRVDSPAPPLSATLLNGTTMSLSASHGRVLLLSYWATWCPPCRHELPELTRLYKTYHEQGLDILAVSMDVDPDDRKAARVMAEKLPFPVAFQDEVKAPGYGRIWALPMVFLIDRQGVLKVDGWAGLKEADFPKLEETVKQLMAGAVREQVPAGQ